jgi:hypothetical protein
MSIGAIKEKNQWWNIWRWWTMLIMNVRITNNQKLGPSSSMINLRTPCALSARNISAKEIFLNWRRSKQEVSNSVGNVLLVSTGFERETTRPHKKRKLNKTKSKLTYLENLWLTLSQC